MTPKIVLVTGANTGIGFEAVKALYNSPQEYRIIVGSRDLQKGKAAIASLELSTSKNTLTHVQIDLTDDTSIENCYKTVTENFGRIDTLINNAGASFDQEIVSGRMTIREAYTKVFDLNITGTEILTHTFIPLLLKSSDPRVLFITSGASSLAEASVLSTNTTGVRGGALPAGWPKNQVASFTSYRISKAGLNMAMLEWTRALHNDGVKCWAIAPGFLATGLGGNTEALKKAGAQHPSIGGEFIRSVVEGGRDGDVGKVIRKDETQPW